jgi:hypothetical protein
MLEPTKPSKLDTHYRQTIEGDRNQSIGQAVSSTIFNVTGGQITIYPSQLDRSAPVEPPPSTSPIGANPYKGLLAFQVTDGDRFFGREKEIKILWEKLSLLHEEPERTSILPIYGSSGSGKSSLAQAGLIPELARRPLPGRDRSRVAILVPGTHPLEALAAVLARVATHDPTPVAKTREFATELAKPNAAGTYDGLRRIVNVLPETHVSPLILLVDQFEEIYTLCKDSEQRDRFVENLLEAAAEQAQQVLIILTLRSDFLGEIQKHPALNRLFSEQGFSLPAMDKKQLRRAIAKPAALAGHPLNQATIALLIKETEGLEGALPLLQFTLTRIWEGLSQGKELAETPEALGKALREAAQNQLERCADVTAIALIHRSLTVTGLEGPVDTLLRSFNRISEDVSAALNQNSIYNQRLALTAVADHLDRLLRELTRSSNKYDMRFRPIAQCWCDIIALKLEKLTKATESRQEIDSPYIIGVPLTERQAIFVGRTDISSRIEQLLLDRRRPPLLLYGQRRTGKTSLLNNLGRLLPNRVIPLFVDLQGPASRASDHAGFLYNIARGMIDSAKRQRRLMLPALPREELTADPFTRFDEWLDAVEATLQDNTALLALKCCYLAPIRWRYFSAGLVI